MERLEIVESSPLDVPRFVWRHKGKMLATFVAGVALTLLYFSTAARVYRSEAKVLVRIGRESITLDPTATTGQFVGVAESRDSELHAVEELVASRATAEKIVDQFGAGVILEKKSGSKSTCANCHRLFGDGGNIAPDLTGSGRHNLDYLLSNIIDPSSVVNKDFRMSILRMTDGRVLNGLITSQDEDRVVLQTAKEKLTFMKSEIDDIKLTTLSPMPEGILQPLQPDQIRDLIAYLMSPTQVELPSQ